MENVPFFVSKKYQSFDENIISNVPPPRPFHVSSEAVIPAPAFAGVNLSPNLFHHLLS